MKCMADSKKNKHRDLGSKRVIQIKIPDAICLVYTFSSA